MKSIGLFIFFVFVATGCMALISGAPAYAEQIRGIELVLLAEDSEALNKIDPDGERFEAINILIDLMDPSDLVGALKFGPEITLVRELGWKGTGQTGRELAKSLRDAGPGSRIIDMEKGLQKAFELFRIGEDAGDVPERIVVVIGSGQIELGGDDRNEASRSRIISEILPAYQKHGIKIYAIGINQKQNRELLEALGSLSAGFHFALESPHNISASAIDIFNDIKRLDIAPLEGLSFKIGEDVEEALVVSSGEGPVDEKCGILNPERVFFSKGKNTEDVHWSGYKKYNIIRLNKPKAGRWNLHSKATRNCVVFLDSPRRINFMIPRKLMFHDENIVVAAYLDQGGRMVQHPQILERTVFKASLENGNHNETASVELESTEPGIYTGALPLEGFAGMVRLNLYALSTEALNKSYALINVSEKSWLELLSPALQVPSGEFPAIEAQVLSELDAEGRYEMAVQLDRSGVGSWSARLEKVKGLAVFKGRIAADLDPGEYTLSFMLRRFSNPVAEEMQVKTFNIHVTGMIEQTDSGGFGWLLIIGGAGLFVFVSVGGFFWFRRRRRLAALIREDVPAVKLPSDKEKEKPQAAVLEDMEDPQANKNAGIFDGIGSTPRVDPLEQLTQNIKVEESTKEPKLAIESQGLADVIDQVVQNVDGRVEKEVISKKKVTGKYEEEEEILMVRSGGNISLNVPPGPGIDRLAESLDSAEDSSARLRGGSRLNNASDKLLSEVLEVAASDEPVLLGGSGNEITGTETISDKSAKASEQKLMPGETPLPKLARVPSPPQVSQNELDAILQQARQSTDKK